MYISYSLHKIDIALCMDGKSRQNVGIYLGTHYVQHSFHGLIDLVELLRLQKANLHCRCGLPAQTMPIGHAKVGLHLLGVCEVIGLEISHRDIVSVVGGQSLLDVSIYGQKWLEILVS